jgi:hypothetical protein
LQSSRPGNGFKILGGGGFSATSVPPDFSEENRYVAQLCGSAIPQLTAPLRIMTSVAPSHLAFVLGISARWIFELTRRGVLAKDPQSGHYPLQANVEAFLAQTRQREAERAEQTEASLSAVLFRASQVLVAAHEASPPPTARQPESSPSAPSIEPQPEPQTRNRWKRR